MNYISLILVTLLKFLFVALCLHIIWMNIYWRGKKIKCFITHCLVNNVKMLTLQQSIYGYLAELYKMCNDRVIGFHLVGKKSLVIRDPELIKHILVKDFDNFPNRTMANNHDGDPMGTKILFVTKTPQWKVSRLSVASGFSSGVMKNIYPDMHRVGQNFIEYLHNNTNKSLDVYDVCCKFSTDIITNSSFGHKCNCFTDDNALSRKASSKIFAYNFSRGIQFACYFICPTLVKIFNLKFLDPPAAKFVEKMFWDIKNERQKLGETRNDFVGLLIRLLENKTYYKAEDEIMAMAAQFFLAGFDTVGTTLAYAFYELAIEPEVQKRARKEVRDAAAKYNGEITYECLQNLPYLQMIFQETIRKYPVVPFLDREALNDYKDPNSDLIIEKGTYVYVPTLGLQYDPKYYPEPEKFDPERFSLENKNKIPTYALLPFGYGPRSCIGIRVGKLSSILGLAKVLHEFEITADPIDDLSFNPKGFLLHPNKRIYLKFSAVL